MDRAGHPHILDRNSIPPLLLLLAVRIITVGSVLASRHFAIQEAASAQVEEL